ncbi:hypothetical protein ALP05_200047 [Pseudomonas caricapapayae]|uniref:Uncharacterized protein n=1 Tax=Pseudomonas caricapapayae TaxID=46678 RepID=A0A3M6F068_9PSED|nr:hypothetical protein ALP05_200047 [Pseudomonas caricapapayae]
MVCQSSSEGFYDQCAQDNFGGLGVQPRLARTPSLKLSADIAKLLSVSFRPKPEPTPRRVFPQGATFASTQSSQTGKTG